MVGKARPPPARQLERQRGRPGPFELKRMVIVTGENDRASVARVAPRRDDDDSRSVRRARAMLIPHQRGNGAGVRAGPRLRNRSEPVRRAGRRAGGENEDAKQEASHVQSSQRHVARVGRLWVESGLPA